MRHGWLSVTAWAAVAAGATAVSLAAVTTVRGVVADTPVQALSRSDVDGLLAQPNPDLERVVPTIPRSSDAAPSVALADPSPEPASVPRPVAGVRDSADNRDGAITAQAPGTARASQAQRQPARSGAGGRGIVGPVANPAAPGGLSRFGTGDGGSPRPTGPVRPVKPFPKLGKPLLFPVPSLTPAPAWPSGSPSLAPQPKAAPSAPGQRKTPSPPRVSPPSLTPTPAPTPGPTQFAQDPGNPTPSPVRSPSRPEQAVKAPGKAPVKVKVKTQGPGKATPRAAKADAQPPGAKQAAEAQNRRADSRSAAAKSPEVKGKAKGQGKAKGRAEIKDKAKGGTAQPPGRPTVGVSAPGRQGAAESPSRPPRAAVSGPRESDQAGKQSKSAKKKPARATGKPVKVAAKSHPGGARDGAKNSTKRSSARGPHKSRN